MPSRATGVRRGGERWACRQSEHREGPSETPGAHRMPPNGTAAAYSEGEAFGWPKSNNVPAITPDPITPSIAQSVRRPQIADRQSPK